MYVFHNFIYLVVPIVLLHRLNNEKMKMVNDDPFFSFHYGIKLVCYFWYMC